MKSFNCLNFPAEIYIVFQWKYNGILVSVNDPLDTDWNRQALENNIGFGGKIEAFRKFHQDFFPIAQ